MTLHSGRDERNYFGPNKSLITSKWYTLGGKFIWNLNRKRPSGYRLVTLFRVCHAPVGRNKLRYIFTTLLTRERCEIANECPHNIPWLWSLQVTLFPVWDVILHIKSPAAWEKADSQYKKIIEWFEIRGKCRRITNKKMWSIFYWNQIESSWISPKRSLLNERFKCESRTRVKCENTGAKIFAFFSSDSFTFSLLFAEHRKWLWQINR